MEVLKLVRVKSDDDGTFGMIRYHAMTFLTGELPWRENKPMLSCIPVGEYDALWCWSAKFQRKTYCLVGVLGRTAIRIHPANYMGDESKGKRSELDGCIAMGLEAGYKDGQWILTKSKKAVNYFESLLRFEPFHLVISEELSDAEGVHTAKGEVGRTDGKARVPRVG